MQRGAKHAVPRGVPRRQAKLMKLQQDMNKEGSEIERPEPRPPMQLLNELRAQMQDKSSALLCGNVTEKLDTAVGVQSMEVFCGYQCVKALLEAKADPNVPDLCQNNPIFKAVSQGQMESTRLLLDAGAKIYIHNIYGDTPLHRAAWSGRYDLIKVLLDHVPPPKPRTADAEDSDEERAAAEAGTPKIEQPIEYFNAAKYINERNQFGDTALHMAAFKGRIDCVNLLLSYDADIGFTNMLGWTALHCACAQGHVGIVQVLMQRWKQKGLPWTHLQTTTTGDSFVHLAIKGARIELINYFLKTQGPAFAKQNRKGEVRLGVCGYSRLQKYLSLHRRAYPMYGVARAKALLRLEPAWSTHSALWGRVGPNALPQYPMDVLVALTSEDKKGKGAKKGKAGGKVGAERCALHPACPPRFASPPRCRPVPVRHAPIVRACGLHACNPVWHAGVRPDRMLRRSPLPHGRRSVEPAMRTGSAGSREGGRGRSALLHAVWLPHESYVACGMPHFGSQAGKKGKKGAAEPEVIEVPIRTQGFFPVIVGVKQGTPLCAGVAPHACQSPPAVGFPGHG
jgi:ankyrin repeat protein